MDCHAIDAFGTLLQAEVDNSSILESFAFGKGAHDKVSRYQALLLEIEGGA
jgi:hypothetical protein